MFKIQKRELTRYMYIYMKEIIYDELKKVYNKHQQYLIITIILKIYAIITISNSNKYY